MKLQCEHFIYGSFKGKGYQLIKSSGIDKLLSREDITYFTNIANNVTQETYGALLFLEQNSAVYFYAKPDKDELGRKTTWLHIIIVKDATFIIDKIQPVLNANIQETVPIFQPYFIKDLSKVPKNLEPLTIEITE